MTKEKFGEIIETINGKVPNGNQKAMLQCAEEELGKLTLRELVAYQNIFNEYLNAARRQYLWAASAAVGAHCTDDGFVYFRSWLISRGNKAYMEALRDPETLADGPIREGEKLNFELFAYVPHKVYEKKFKEAKEQMGEYSKYDDLFAAQSAYPLDKKEKKAIQAELPKRKDIKADWCESDLPRLFPHIFSIMEDGKTDVAKMLWTSVGAENLIRGHVCDITGITVYLFENSPRNIACFIGSRPMTERIVVTDFLDREIVSTYGWFIDRCPDKTLLGKITSVLVPIQMGEAQPEPLLVVTEVELNAYLKQIGEEDGEPV